MLSDQKDLIHVSTPFHSQAENYAQLEKFSAFRTGALNTTTLSVNYSVLIDITAEDLGKTGLSILSIEVLLLWSTAPCKKIVDNARLVKRPL